MLSQHVATDYIRVKKLDYGLAPPIFGEILSLPLEILEQNFAQTAEDTLVIWYAISLLKIVEIGI